MKYLLTLALMFGVSMVASAAVRAPKDNTGVALHTVDFVGVETCRVNTSTSTNAVLCYSGAGFVYGISISSAAADNYAVLRDSGTANTTSTPLWTVWADDGGADEAGTLLFNLPAPIKFANGLVLNVNAALGPGTGSEVVVLYRKASATE